MYVGTNREGLYIKIFKPQKNRYNRYNRYI